VSTAGAAANAALLATGNAHVADLANPHAVSAAQVSLPNVDNTSDLAKPVSTAQQSAIDIAAMYRRPVVFMTGDVLPGATMYDPATGVITLPSAGELNDPGIGHVMGVGDRLLVAQQADTRENGVYLVSDLGSNSTPYVLTRAPETLVGGMALTIQQPISALVFLEESGTLTVDDPALANNDWVVLATPGATVVPANLSIATLTCSGAASCAALDTAAITGDSLSVTGVMDCGGASTIGGALTASAAVNVTGLLTAGTVAASRIDCSGDLTGGHVYGTSGGSAADIRLGWYDAARQTGFYNPAANTIRFATGGIDRVQLDAGGISTLSGSKDFRINHPLSPADMNLKHACLEGPEVLCVYRMRAVVGADGTVVAPLPAYWMALNCEPCYLLTSLGAPQPNLHVAAEVADSAGSIAFTIGGGVAGASVSWLVTGRRCDPQLGGPGRTCPSTRKPGGAGCVHGRQPVSAPDPPAVFRAPDPPAD
jgi:hypothetical protein